MRLSEAIRALLVATRASGRSAQTVDAYRRKLKPLLTFVGDIPVDAVTTDILRRYIAHLMDRKTRWVDHPKHQEQEGRLSLFTVASHVRAVKRLFNWLEEEGVIETNPARRIRVPRPRSKEPHAIALEDFLALLKTTDGGSMTDLRDRAIILFLADTGCRVGGLCNLQVQDVDLDAGLARVTEKGEKIRLVPFTQPTAEALKSWMEVRPKEHGPWLFVSLGNKARGRLSPNGVRCMLRRRARRAGVRGRVNPHAFRHAFAREFLLSGGDLATLADLLGHSSVEVTRAYYAIFTIQELKEKHRRHSPVARLLGGDEDGDS